MKILWLILLLEITYSNECESKHVDNYRVFFSKTEFKLKIIDILHPIYVLHFNHYVQYKEYISKDYLIENFNKNVLIMDGYEKNITNNINKFDCLKLLKSQELIHIVMDNSIDLENILTSKNIKNIIWINPYQSNNYQNIDIYGHLIETVFFLNKDLKNKLKTEDFKSNIFETIFKHGINIFDLKNEIKDKKELQITDDFKIKSINLEKWNDISENKKLKIIFLFPSSHLFKTENMIKIIFNKLKFDLNLNYETREDNDFIRYQFGNIILWKCKNLSLNFFIENQNALSNIVEKEFWKIDYY